MQSGKQNSKKWLMLPIEEEKIRSINPLTGWVSAKNTQSQLRFEFLSKEDAIKFAEKKGFAYEIDKPQMSKIRPKSYAANFTS